MKKIGITGGIGSGKSIVAKVLEAMNYPVYYSDDRSKIIVDTDPEIRSELIKLIGTEVYQDDKLNRPFLAKLLFSDDEIRHKVNKIIHPVVREDFENWMLQQESNLIFNEAAIFFETGGHKTMDFNILVIAPFEIKIHRIMKRDNISREEVLERMSKQWSDEKKIPLADFVLVNDDVTPLLMQIETVIEKLKN